MDYLGIDTYALFNYFLRPYHNKQWLRKGEHISNPFLSTKQKTPSFSIFHKNGFWMFKDFATGDSGDLVTLVQRLDKCNYIQAERKIKELSGLKSDFEPKTNDITDVSIDYKNFEEHEIAYFKQFGIKGELFVESKLNIKCVKSFSYTKNEERKTKNSRKDNPIFIYDTYGKIYMPLNKYEHKGKKIDDRFRWLKEKTQSYIFGLENIDNAEFAICTGGEKDVLTLQSHGIPAFCFNSETFIPSTPELERIYAKTDSVYVLYDIDATGASFSEKLQKHLGWNIIGDRLRLDLNKFENTKDISDWFRLLYQDKLNCKEYDGWIEKEIDLIKERKELESDFKGREVLFSDPLTEPNYFFKYKDTNLLELDQYAIIVSQPGVGKSNFAQTLTSEYVVKKYNKTYGTEHTIDSFNFDISIDKEKNMLYVDTETSPKILRRSMEKIYNRVKESGVDTSKILRDGRLMGAEIWSQFDAMGIDNRLKLENRLQKGDIGFLIIDNFDKFSDSYSDEDAAHEAAIWFNSLLITYNIGAVVMFHSNKGSDVISNHLGSWMLKLARLTLYMETKDVDRGIKAITTEFSNKKMSNEYTSFTQCIVWDKEKGYFVSSDEEIGDKHRDWFKRVLDTYYKSNVFIIQDDLIKHCVLNEGKSKSVVDKKIKEYIELKLLTKKGNNLYKSKKEIETNNNTIEDDVPF